jgi:tape measure domain-containing protein
VLDDLSFKIDVDTTGGLNSVEALDASLTELKDVFDSASSQATDAQFTFSGLSRSLTAVSVAAKPLALLNGNMGLIAQSTSLAAGGAAQMAGAFGLASTVATFLGAGLGVLLAPLAGLVIIPKIIAASFGIMFAVILAPLKLAIAAVTLFAKGAWAVVSPFVALAAAVFKFKVAMKSIRIQVVLMVKFLSLLPPKIRMIVVGLIALGAAGKAGRVGLRILSAGAKLLRVALLSLTQPLQALRVLAVGAAKNFGIFTLGVIRATRSLVRFGIAKAVSGMKSLGSSVLSVSGMIVGKLLSAFRAAAKGLTAVLAVSAGWGVKLAADAEQAEIAFATMLKSGEAAKAVLAELEQFAASTPFQLDSLRSGAKQLLNAQVPAAELTTRLRMLGDIAAGAGKPINDFVRIFAKVKATGKVSLETLNQLAERGVPIYTALQSELGKSRGEMLDMISKGTVGFGDMDRALQSLTNGSGVFAGGMAAQSQTISGLWSTMKDNVAFAARELGVNIIKAFDFKALLARGIELFQSLKQGIANAMPAFTAIAIVVKAAFSAVWEVVSVTFGLITSAMGVAGGNWLQSFVEWAAVAAFAFKSWPTLAELAFTKIGLWLVQAGSQFVHLFTGVLPALFTWFGDNWAEVFFTAADLVATVFINIGKNIRDAMTAIWDFISSGGTSGLALSWTPLLDGFKNTIRELPDIPPRAIGALEKQLQADSDRLGSALSSGLADEIASNLKMLDDFKAEQANAKAPTLDGVGGPDLQATADGSAAATADKNAAENKAALVRSSAGQSVVTQFLRGLNGSDDTKKQTAAAVASASSLSNIERDVRGGGLQTQPFGAA